MDKIRRFFINTGYTLMITFWILIILGCLTVAMFYIMAHFSEDIVVNFDVNGRHDLDFSVFYLPNQIWEENPKPRDLYFLMSFTDFIEVKSGLSVTLSEETQIDYSFTATERLVIRYRIGADADSSPVVFTEEIILSEQSGSRVTNRLRFNAEDEMSPGGVYTLHPRPHIDTYFDFVASQAYQMYGENLTTLGLRGFSAELFIDFTYTINIPEHKITETITQGYRISLTSEVYSLVVTGQPSFGLSFLVYKHENVEITMPLVVLFVAVFSAGVFGLVYTLRRYAADPLPNRHKALTILKKYAGEIVVTDNLVDLTQYKLMIVKEFSELLKLAVNLSKHIMCYHDIDRAEFVTIVDGYAYTFSLEYHPRNNLAADEEARVP